MIFILGPVALFAFYMISAQITGLSASAALRFDIIDRPNQRSLHTAPTPRIGGVGIVIPCLLGGLLLKLFYGIDPTREHQLTGLLMGGFLISLISFMDDVLSSRQNYLWHHSAFVKLTGQLAAAVIVLLYGIQLHSIQVFSREIQLGQFSVPITLLWILCMTNLYNFMDGIDGICAGTALINAIFFAILFYLHRGHDLVGICLLVSLGCLGFLRYNFPPARVFMGDVGSMFLGFMLATLAILGSQGSNSGLFIPCVIVCAAFIYDASFTFLRRIYRERTIVAHRTHLYQRLALLGYTPRRVITAYYFLSSVFGCSAILWTYADPHTQFILAFVIVMICASATVFVYGLEAGSATERLRAAPSRIIKVCHVSLLDTQILLLLNQLRLLRSDGYEIHVICHLTKFSDVIEKGGFRVHPIPLYRRNHPLADLRLVFQLLAIMRRERFDIVHTHTPKMELAGQVAAKLTGIPVVVHTSHGFYFRKAMPNIVRSFVIWIAKIAGLFSDHIFIQSQSDTETALEKQIYDPQRVSFLGNGVDLRVFDRGRFSAEMILEKKRELGISTDRLVIGMVGRYVDEKGYREFVEAAGVLSSIHANLFFLTVGMNVPGERDPFDAEPAKRSGANLLVLESRLDMPELYSVMDVIALPSYREGFPKCLVEACAMSLPIVATDIHGCREAVNDGVNGLLIPVEQVPPLVSALDTLIRDKALREKMGKAGRCLAEQHFDERIVVNRIRIRYDQLLKEKPVLLGKTSRVDHSQSGGKSTW